MEMHHIRYFLAVCDTLNFTRAAERCNVTQPALSRAIQQLEEEVGGLLFRRERNATHLTDLGGLLRPRLQQIHEQTEEAKVAARKFLTLEEATLTLGVMCTVGPIRFAGCLADFRAAQAGVDLKLVEGMPGSLADRLESGDIDVAIMTPPPPDRSERLDSHTLYSERFMLALPPGHRLARQPAIRFEEIGEENYLRRLNCEFRDRLGEICVQKGSKLNVCHQSEREDWIQNMVAAGFGVCFIPEFSAVGPGLQLRPMIDPDVTRDVALVTMSGRRFSPAVAAFVKSVKAYKWPSGTRYAAEMAA